MCKSSVYLCVVETRGRRAALRENEGGNSLFNAEEMLQGEVKRR